MITIELTPAEVKILTSILHEAGTRRKLIRRRMNEHELQLLDKKVQRLYGLRHKILEQRRTQLEAMK